MRLIDADAFKEYITSAFEDTKHLFSDGGAVAKRITESFCEDIDEQPTIQPETSCSEIPNSWIPCSKRLPKDDTEVLVYLFENNKSPYIAWLSDGRWYTEYFEVERENEPVAWMPLPEPYQGGEQE